GLLVASLALVGACKKAGGGEALARMTEFKDRMCACKDKACTDQVTQEMTRWASEHKAGEAGKPSEEEQKKVAALTADITKCMTKYMTAPGAGSAAAGSAGSATGSGSAAGSAAAGSGSDAGSAAGGAGAGSSAAGGETMAHRAGMCPSTVLGATTTAAVKGKAVVVTIAATDKDAIAAIRKRTDKLLAEKKTAPTGRTHDQKGSYGGGQGLCPVHVPEGARATAKHQAKGVVVTITPKGKPDELAKEIDGRIARAADWVKANVPPGDQGNQGGVGGGKGQDGSNHSGKGDGKGHERKKGGDGGGGGKGTGGGRGKGTGGGAGTGSDGGGW
ncbi:MAG TPA: hypothetical protein VFK02_08750, partial [Kofleriaceae bacterium]|nr:hypothetical protein [Kofleriaceae bacterium]